MIAIVFRKKEKLFCKIVVPFVFVDEIIDDIAAGHDADEAPPVVLDGDEGVLLHPSEQIRDRRVLPDRGIDVAPDDLLQPSVLQRVQVAALRFVENAEKIAVRDRADVAPLPVDDGDGVVAVEKHLLQRLPEGEIVVEIADREAKRLGISIIRTRTWDATRVDSAMVEKADKVLCDVPCSGFGVIRRKPEIKYRKNEAEIEALPAKQLAILKASASYVKPGGVLMYCTCTINPYENERVVADFLRKTNSFKVEESRQFMPNIDGTDGFFICKMRKVNDIINREMAGLR